MSPYVFPGLANGLAKLTIKEIAERVSAYYHLTYQQLFQKNRTRDIVKARHTMMWVLRNKLNLTYKEIAAHFHMDHTTIIHGCQTMEDLMDVYPECKEDVEAVVKDLREPISLHFVKA